MRVVRGDRKGTQCPRVYLDHSVPEGYKYGDLALQVGGVSRIGSIKYGLESRGTQIRAGLRWRGPAATVITDPSSRQRGRYKIRNPQLSKEKISRER
jgi:hypothetical protein